MQSIGDSACSLEKAAYSRASVYGWQSMQSIEGSSTQSIEAEHAVY